MQAAVESPARSGTGIDFIDTVAQNEQGVITAHKRRVRSASASQSGLMSAADKTKLDGIVIPEAWPVSKGGTGDSGVVSTTAAAEIATAAEGMTITSARYYKWGMMAMVCVNVTVTNAVASGTTTLCTMAEGKRPVYTAMAQWQPEKMAYITSGGLVKVDGAISAMERISILSTYLLA